MIWPDLTRPEVIFEIDLSRSNGTFSEPSRRAQDDGAFFIFISLLSNKLFMENQLHVKKYFFFDDLWSRGGELRVLRVHKHPFT